MTCLRFSQLAFLVIFLSSCGGGRWDVDTTDVEYNAEFGRLDIAIFNMDPASAKEELEKVHSAYGPFANTYLQEIMQIGPVDNAMTPGLLMRFTTDPMWVELQSIIEERHPDLQAEANELANAFSRYAVLFDESRLPKLVAYNSGFNYGIYPSEDFLGVGLEWYSGHDFNIIKQLPPDLFPQYKRDKMKPEFLTINALKGWLFFKYQDILNDDDLLARMVFSGKVLYTAEALMGDVKEAELLNYTEEQLSWCKKNEFDIWKHFVEQDAIFSTDQTLINKMMNDGPFTPGMPPESPGGVGTWVGYRMVKAYMDKNKQETLPGMIYNSDNTRFLKHYKPGR